MRISMGVLLALLGTVAIAHAQMVIPPGAQLAVVHSAPATVDRFELAVGTGGYASVGKTPCTDVPTEFCFPAPTLTTGFHVLHVRACNAVGCSASFDFQGQSGTAPVAPSGVRVVAGVTLPAPAPAILPLSVIK